MSLFGWLDRTKIGAEIAKIAFEIWCMIVDRSRHRADRERRIKELEDQVALLKRRLDA